MKEVFSLMKLSGLLFGGIIGAAATMYVAKKKPATVAWAAGAMSDMCSGIVRKSVAKMVNADWKKEAAAGLSPKPSDDTAGKSAAAWEQIEAIVETDPSLKREVNKIKAESSAMSH
ncbi:hypothetical protein D3P07_07285 [Paenibacillus sp. 1011MAR3C5]|uniref:hypothetical protein n=1 Tax=Paenibacillus sp. 1011MAR3C5 TaxID=1675787 RepID=UPI000E6C5D70|nr:hypothetical protein [Paenibacillus sp. 1011MAR3C5]RJE90012.1 hypothetical protein D3P07_07285 [Paenibacillus sp. 1011MAR3C5]